MKKILFILLAIIYPVTICVAEEVLTEQSIQVEMPYLWHDGKDFYVGGTLLTKQECQNLLKNTCPAAFRQYEKGNKLIKAGWSLFGIGLFAVATPWIPYTIDNPYNSNWDYQQWDSFYDRQDMAVQIWLVAGCAITAASIPMLCVGYSTRKRCVNIYNYECHQKKPDIRYILTANQNGLVFAIHF